MKPIRLKFAAFGPYAEEQTIEFDKLCESGLFLIHGETGSGKTVILDALTYALYGESSGGIRGGLASMRCQFADEKTETYTEFTFEAHSQIYTFSRRLKAVHKRSGDIEYNPVQTVLLRNADGTDEPLFENPKSSLVRAEAQRIIGLDYEQFRQIIILPQGQFEKLLVADSGAKEQILSTLFSAQRWDRVSAYLIEKAREEKSALSELESQISHIYEENSCESTEDMNALCEKLKSDVSALEQEKENCAKEYKSASDAYDKTKELFDAYERRRTLNEKLNALEQRADEINGLSSLLRHAENALKSKPVYDILVSAQNSAEQRKRALDIAEKSAETAQTEFETAKEKHDSLNKRTEEIALLEKRVSKLENLREIYSSITTAAEKTDEADKTKKKAEKKLAKLEDEHSELSEERSQLEEKQARLYEEYILMFRSSDVAERLASELEDGAPCPVCGSLTHPKKAVSCGGVSADELSDKQDEIDKASDALKSVKQRLSSFDETLAAARAQLQSAAEEYTRRVAEYNALTESADDEFESEKALNDEINRISKEISNFRADLDKAAAALDGARTELSAQQAQLKAAQTEYEGAEKTLADKETIFKEELRKYGFDGSEEFEEYLISAERIDEIRADVTEYESDIAAVRKSLALADSAPEERPDIDGSLEKRETAHEKYEKASNALAVAQGDAERCEKQIKKLKRLESKREKQHEHCAKISAFAEAVAGSKGISLKRYVLGVMLSAVTAEANRMLKNVHGGRYRLYRRAEMNSKAKKLGLGLEVFDSYSGKRRDVSTLSGGEKFLVSLALSIGLSSTVQTQSGGIRTDAMFIDEGFGTLDSGSVADALDILSGLRRADSVIGIISHIPALRENIHACIEVTKQRTGSSIDVHI